MTIYFQRPNGSIIALNINAITESKLGDIENPHGATLIYKSRTEWHLLIKGETVSAPGCSLPDYNGVSWFDELSTKGYEWLRPISDQSDGEFYDDILEINTP